MTSISLPGPRLRVLSRGLVLIVTLGAIGFLLEGLGFRQAVDTAWIDARIRGQGLRGDALFVAVGALFIGIGLPRQAVCFLGGYAFGFAEGVLWSSLASVVGCIGAYFYARFLGRGLVAAHFPERVARLHDFLDGNTLSMSLLLRLLPVGSNLLVNLAAGVSGVPALAFFAGSALGYLPQSVVFALLGSGIQVDPVFRIATSVLLFIVSAGLGLWLFRRYRHGRRLDAATEAALQEGDESGDATARLG